MNNQTESQSVKKTTLCPHCKEEVNPKASRCSHCHGKIYQWTFTKKFIAGGVLIIIAFAIVGSISGSGSEATPADTTSTAPVSTLKDGSTEYLNSSSGGPVVGVATTRVSAEKIAKLVQAGNNQAILDMVSSGEIFMTADKTQVKIIASDSVYAKVQILNGAYENHSGWVPLGAVSS